MLEDRIEHGPGMLGEIRHELAEFAVEVAEKQQSLVAQDGEARVVDRADRVCRLEQLRHQGWKLLRQRLCIRGRLQGKPRVKWFWLMNDLLCYVARGRARLPR